MSKDHSFDIVSQVDFQEVSNAVEQTRKEIAQRYDFKGAQVSIEWNKEEKLITLAADTDMRMRALGDVLQTRCAKRQISLKALDFEEPEKATGNSLRQKVKIKHGIPSETAKEIVKSIKQSKIKAQAQIREDEVRVQSAKIDFLQEVIQLVKQEDFGIDLQFINYR